MDEKTQNINQKNKNTEKLDQQNNVEKYFRKLAVKKVELARMAGITTQTLDKMLKVLPHRTSLASKRKVAKVFEDKIPGLKRSDVFPHEPEI